MKIACDRFKISKVLHTIHITVWNSDARFCWHSDFAYIQKAIKKFKKKNLYIKYKVMLWFKKSLDCLPEKAEKICTSSFHQHLISSTQLGINLALVKPQISPWEGRRGLREKEK